MKTYVVCGNRTNKQVVLPVCLLECDVKHECNEFKKVDRATLEAEAKKLGIPASKLKGLEAVINVDVEPVKDKPEPKPTKALVKVQKQPSIETRRSLIYYEKALEVKKEIQAKFLEMGSILNEIYNNKYYVDYGYQDWKQFCSEALDIQWRTAIHLRNIYIRKMELNLSEQECAEIGWSKLSIILPVMNDKKEAKKWMATASEKGMTSNRLSAKVRHARGRISMEEAEKVPSKFIFSLYEEQLDNVERALELAGKVAQSDKRGHLLEMICVDYLSGAEGQEDVPKMEMATRLIRRIEALFHVKVGEITDLQTEEMA